ncbi:hypothetical protein IFO70_09855 [Phormidium tenue FACHB-886]|nr:hypothetical protein [Phormidium tenue FACHB-886]
MNTLLDTISPDQIFTDPFPHIVITDALEEQLCRRLIEQFPSIDLLSNGKLTTSNERFSYPTRDVLNNLEISPLWREFIQAQSSPTFWSQIVRLFKPEILRLHPSFEQTFGAIDSLQPGVRKVDNFSTADVLLDAQICINAPVLQPSPLIKQAHVDRPQVVYAGLYYLRHPDDRSTGGNLEIYRFKGKPYSLQGQYIDDKYIERVKTVQYERNVLVLFINSVQSLHGVTVRSVTETPRCFVNLIGEVKQPLYDLRAYQEKQNLVSQFTRRLSSVKP